jgi:hypothetical protein
LFYLSLINIFCKGKKLISNMVLFLQILPNRAPIVNQCGICAKKWQGLQTHASRAKNIVRQQCNCRPTLCITEHSAFVMFAQVEPARIEQSR